MHQRITVTAKSQRITVALDIVPDDDNPTAWLSASNDEGDQLAKVQVAPSFKLDRARALGLDTPILVDKASSLSSALEKAGESFDVVLDLVGGAYVGETLPAMALRGRIVVVGLTAGAQSDLNLAILLRQRLSVIGTVLRSRPLEEKIQAADLLRRTLSPWLARGMIKPVIEATLPLERAGDAHRMLASNKTFGKVLLTMS